MLLISARSSSSTTNLSLAGYPVTYPQVHGAIQNRFHVNSYADIPEDHYEVIMSFLREMWRRMTKGEQPEQGNLF